MEHSRSSSVERDRSQSPVEHPDRGRTPQEHRLPFDAVRSRYEQQRDAPFSSGRSGPSRSEIPPAREGFMRLQGPDGRIHMYRINANFSSLGLPERREWDDRQQQQWNGSYQKHDRLDGVDMMLLLEGSGSTFNGWKNLDARAARTADIKGRLQENYAQTRQYQEEHIRYLARKITQSNPHLAGEVIEIRTRYGQAYQKEMNRLNILVMRQQMDPAIRDEQEITLCAQLYADQGLALERKHDELGL